MGRIVRRRRRYPLMTAVSLAAVLLGMTVAVPAQAATPAERNGAVAGASAAASAPRVLTVDGGWQSFVFGERGSSVTFHVTTSAEAWLRLTDAFCAGDRFRVFDKGRMLRPTSEPAARSCDVNTRNLRTAEVEDEWSSGGWILAPGRHEITIEVTASPFGAGRAFLRADSPAFARAPLSGANEVPGPGDPDGTGTSNVTLHRAQASVCFVVNVSGIGAVAAGHIHVGGPDVAGPVVVDLGLAGDRDRFTGCVPADRAVINGIAYEPWNYYINVHTPAFPAGAVRGQLIPLYTK